MAKLFICYRRDDSLDIAGRLNDRLARQYGDSNVVMDIDSVPIGRDFRVYLDSQIKQCDVFLVLIGRHWLGASSSEGVRRLEDTRDYVRVEIESAFRQQLPVVPVLVGGATMPREEDLPGSLAALAYINAAEIASSKDFSVHVGRLINGIDDLVKSAPEVEPKPLKKREPGGRKILSRDHRARVRKRPRLPSKRRRPLGAGCLKLSSAE